MSHNQLKDRYQQFNKNPAVFETGLCISYLIPKTANIEWIQSSSNRLRQKTIQFTDFKDLSILQAYNPAKYEIESSPVCNGEKIKVDDGVKGTCSFRKCKFSCNNSNLQVSLDSAKCRGNGWRTKDKILTVKCKRKYRKLQEDA